VREKGKGDRQKSKGVQRKKQKTRKQKSSFQGSSSPRRKGGEKHWGLSTEEPYHVESGKGSGVEKTGKADIRWERCKRTIGQKHTRWVKIFWVCLSLTKKVKKKEKTGPGDWKQTFYKKRGGLKESGKKKLHR